MDSKNKKNKKVNHLKLHECEKILQKLQHQKDSHYYNHVLQQYRRLIPSFKDSVILGKTQTISGATFAASYEHTV